jgi:hypothetical protein
MYTLVPRHGYFYCLTHTFIASEMWLDPFTAAFGYSQCFKCTFIAVFNLSPHHLSLSTVTQKNFVKWHSVPSQTTGISVLKNNNTYKSNVTLQSKLMSTTKGWKHERVSSIMQRFPQFILTDHINKTFLRSIPNVLRARKYLIQMSRHNHENVSKQIIN